MKSRQTLYQTESVWIVGIDLAWGEKQKDGLCLIKATTDGGEIIKTGETHGDNELVAWLNAHIPADDCALLSIDAPLIVPNNSGSRPVDRAISKEFWKYDACCHSANVSRCERPLRVTRLLRDLGYLIHHDLKLSRRLAFETYPHPGMVRLFDLQRILKYKKGKSKELEFRNLQTHFRSVLRTVCSLVAISPEVNTLLSDKLSQSSEDKTDAVFCALVGYLHWKHDGVLSRIVGTVEEGFILLPPRARNGFFLHEQTDDPVVTNELVKQLMQEED